VDNVSDGSTDGTDEIVKHYAAVNPWIELLRMPERRDRNFAGKVHAFNAGYALVKGLNFDVVGSLDADLSFDAELFSFLLGKLTKEPDLGLVGAPFKDSSMYDYRFVSMSTYRAPANYFAAGVSKTLVVTFR